MASNILFVFEGQNVEDHIYDSFSQHFLDGDAIITCAYCNNLYNLYKRIDEDEDLDTFALLKAMAINIDLSSLNRSDFAEIYMFFDYDGHDRAADDEKVQKMLDLFNEETEKGKLYLSYPMVEAIKHFPNVNDFPNVKVKCKKNIGYKALVNSGCTPQLQNVKIYDLPLWKLLFSQHLSKMNLIVENNFELPKRLMFQDEIFKNQFEKYINIDETVAVLSAFPPFLHDYFGNEAFLAKIKY